MDQQIDPPSQPQQMTPDTLEHRLSGLIELELDYKPYVLLWQESDETEISYLASSAKDLEAILTAKCPQA